MDPKYQEILKAKMSAQDYEKLMALNNERLFDFIGDDVVLCEPEEVLVFDDSPEGVELTRRKAVEAGEEAELIIEGHTVHFDGLYDQGRDREVTKYLVPEGDSLFQALNQIERKEGLREVRGLLKGSMRGKPMLVRFLTLGPRNSVFSIPCVELTDSWYVSHSLNLLYRLGYEEFRRRGNFKDFLPLSIRQESLRSAR